MGSIKALIVACDPAERQSLELLIRRMSDLEIVGECVGREELLEVVRDLDADLVLIDSARLPALLAAEPQDHRSVSHPTANGSDESQAAGTPGPASPVPPRSRFAVKRPNGRITLVGVEEILWIEAARDYVRLYTAEASHLLRATMSGVEGQLDSARFVRVHRSTIVRVGAVKEIKHGPDGRCTVLLSDGTERPVSRPGKKRLEAAIGLSI